MSRNGSCRIDNRGFSLLELLLVIGILAILLSIAVGFGHDWIVRSQVEDETRELFSDLMNARVSALQNNRVYFVKLAANQYAIYEDTNPSPDGDGTLQPAQDTRLLQKNPAYTIDFGSSPPTFDFSSCGLVSESSYTIHIVSSAAPSFDCIVLNPTRLLMGNWNGTDCSLQ